MRTASRVRHFGAGTTKNR